MFKPEPYCERAAWCWLLSNAAWKETRRIGGKGDEVMISEGQLHVSDRSLASVWGWEKKRVRRFLKKLETSKSATINRTINGTVLTLENWGLYQKPEPSEGPLAAPTGDQPGTTQEQGKQGKQENNSSGELFFEGKIIRLNEVDFRQWEKTFSAVADLEAELTSLDAWFQKKDQATQKDWFFMVPGMLNRKQQEILASRQPANLEYGPC